MPIAKSKPTNNPSLPTPISTIHHSDKRLNIPTEELRDFVPDEQKEPTTLLYPRDPSLDPQLVWRGKDDQDRHDLEVPAVPIYIQEKISPQAIIEDLRSSSRSSSTAPTQASLFETFDGLDFEQTLDFYQHEQNWSNRLILGDSLLAMASLAEKEGLKGQVQMIYIDPPYGIKFGSNWQVSTRIRDVRDGKAEDSTRQPEQIKAFRDTWELGIHSYLAYLRDRLVVARELLTESGSVFVQIGDENVHLVRCLLDEVFGSDNYCALIQFKKTGYEETDRLPIICDYLLWYAKDKQAVKVNSVYIQRRSDEVDTAFFDRIELASGEWRALTSEERRDPGKIPLDARIFARNPLVSPGYLERLSQPIEFEGKTFICPPNTHWKTTPEGIRRLIAARRLVQKGNALRMVRYFDDYSVTRPTNTWMDLGTGGFVGDEKVYVVQTDTRVVQRCILLVTSPGDLILDPTCGSGTTSYVAEQWGRRWITIDTSRVALALARTRLMASRFPYYLLADSPEGIKKESELTGSVPYSSNPMWDTKKGFVYKRVPHIMLSTISQDEEIDTIHANYQEQLESLRDQLNQLLSQSWEEWQIPRDPSPSWQPAAQQLHARWWQLRRDRQQEIDASIARRADTEFLYDQPYEDNKRIRVTGPFTVETLSPHRALSQDADQPSSQREAQDEAEAQQFVTTILDNLRKAGVQNTYRNERLNFDTLEPFPGAFLHASGTYTDSVGATHRVAVHIGPKYGTVGPDDIKEAAKETVRGTGEFDTLIVAGLAFDPAVTEEVKQYGKLTVLITRINPDLAMGDELLKKTGSGNLFMVFGEPDISIDPTPDGQLVVTIHGLDIYDPTTGQVRSSSTDDIACWFIDTNYNEEAFFVRHAYFTGAQEPYDKLKRALRAEIDEAAWASLYSTSSRPFDRPTTGKIAIKVINHYGDEVLKVYGV